MLRLKNDLCDIVSQNEGSREGCLVSAMVVRFHLSFVVLIFVSFWFFSGSKLLLQQDIVVLKKKWEGSQRELIKAHRERDSSSQQFFTIVLGV